MKLQTASILEAFLIRSVLYREVPLYNIITIIIHIHYCTVCCLINQTQLRLLIYIITPFPRPTGDLYVLHQILGHVPDMVVHRHPSSPIPEAVDIYGVLLFADISGKGFCTGLIVCVQGLLAVIIM